MKKKVFIYVFVAIFLFVGLTTLFVLLLRHGNNDKSPKKSETEIVEPFGVWWWDDELDSKIYLEFAKNNNVNEIYLCSSKFNNETSKFIESANDYDIKVFLLAGEKEWLNDSTNLHSLIGKYKTYQRTYDNTFSGIHLDIEPHQFDDFSENRETYILSLISLMKELKDTYRDIKFDYDIPFWLDDEVTFNSSTKEAYKHIIDIANRTFVMSYRDTCEDIYDVGEDEVLYAEENKKIVVLCVETKSSEGDKVSFMEEGKDYMNGELKELKKLLPKGFGISVHQIYTWYNLKKY